MRAWRKSKPAVCCAKHRRCAIYFSAPAAIGAGVAQRRLRIYACPKGLHRVNAWPRGKKYAQSCAGWAIKPAVRQTAAKFGARLVPYFPRAQKHLALLASHAKNGSLLSISAESLSNLFRSARDACGITGLTYHDSRVFALTWMAKRIDVMRLAKISGHRNINMLVNTYYRQKAADIAASL